MRFTRCASSRDTSQSTAIRRSISTTGGSADTINNLENVFVPNPGGSATITIDRRLTVGETREIALAELRSLPHLGDAEVELLKYDEVSWRGTRAQQDKYYPTWVLEEDHPLVQGPVVLDVVQQGRGRSFRQGICATRSTVTGSIP